MDRAYRRLVLLLGLIICIPSVVNTHAMSTKQYAKLEYVLTRATNLDMESVLNEPHQHSERIRHLCSCIGRLIRQQLCNHVQIMDYDRYRPDHLSTTPEGTNLGTQYNRYETKSVMEEEVYESISNTGTSQYMQPSHEYLLISYDTDNCIISSQMFISYKVILSKMNNKAIAC